MARKYPTEYAVSKVGEILRSENAFRQDVDLRLDSVERGISSLGADANVLVARVVHAIETEIAPRAAEIEALLAGYREGVPAALVAEEPAGRQFLTPDRRAAILAELRGGVDVAGDTLAKLLALISAVDAAKATPADIAAAIAALKGSAPAIYDTLGEIAAWIAADETAEVAITAALAQRLRVDADQGLSAAQVAQVLRNLRAASATKTADYTAGAGDIGALLTLSGSHTLSFAAAATLGDGWFVDVANAGTGVWVLDPSGSETIDGAATIRVYPGEGFRIRATGAGLRTIGRATGLILINRTFVAGGPSAIDFSLPAEFSFFEMRSVLKSSTGTGSHFVRTSVDGGATFDQGATDYYRSQIIDAGGTVSIFNDYASQIGLVGGLEPIAVATTCKATLYPGATGSNPSMMSQFSNFRADGKLYQYSVTGERRSSVRVTAMRIYTDAGVFADGSVVELYGSR